ncbi:hypothetical protein FN846DRAFT_772943 [Sphaerosporella brunnea]|uniref:Uncharacterized protein n=1 Tax=Sphaerosporella brunnea TaxID=1250544 RepID=A0A5J5F7X5_9PEZI|nr:hypothetical protein FN846DRAFT_772943 [Sphaerosporella brunnea]
MAAPIALATSSQPMFIPSKGRRRENYKPRYTPAVAALLANTAIPPPRKLKRQRKPAVDSYYGPPTPPTHDAFDCASIESEDGSSGNEDSSDRLLSPSKTALELLLSPPEDDDDYVSTAMARSSSEGLLSVRSSSTESVPSLDTDNESILSISSWSQRTRRRSGADPRARIVTSPPEECDLDHPLMFTPEPETTKKQEPEIGFSAEDTLKRVTRRLNLVSNLTASLRVLKSAARSFTSLTAAATAFQQPDDYLTRSILSITPQYTDERRPALRNEEPTPALRRYLNPWISVHEESPCTGAVQMQTYNITGRSKSGRRAEKLEEESCACGPMVRQREVRENSDFLRVIVLEMNMRRGGKLSDTAQGKARYMLPPRQACKLRTLGDPGRWEAWVCVYEN